MAAPAGRPRGRPPSPSDEPLLAELSRDGRASNAALAAAIRWHEWTVRRRIDELRRAACGDLEVDLDGRVFGIDRQAMLWLSVEPAQLDQAGRALAGHVRSRSSPPPPDRPT